MSTLVLNAPKRTVEQGSRSFESTFQGQVGEDYAIYSNLFEQVYTGCKVILLGRDERKQAEGKLIKLEPTYVAGNGVQRYNVHMENLQRVNYRGDDISLNHCGVAVI
jgi:hypothetical protein